MKNVALIYRSKERKEVSIETLFGCLLPYFNENYKIDNYYLPYGHFKRISKIMSNVRYVKKIKADVYHITGEIYISALFTPKKKTIITMHDYINLNMFTGIKKFISWLFWDYFPLKRCKYVVCISKTIYDETLRRFPFCKNKIYYIPNSISDSFLYKKKEFDKSNVKILLMGTRVNKNVERIIEAVNDINCTLYIIGKLSDSQYDLLKKFNVKFHNEYNVSDDRVRKIYEEIDILCFPSTFEGFGRPIIEANSIGRPVITSDLAPMKEVANGSACLVDPYNVDSIRKAILKLIEDDDYRNELINRGLENAKKYSSDYVSKLYSELYEKIL